LSKPLKKPTPSLLLFGAQESRAGIKPENEDAVAMHLPSDSSLRTKGAVAAIADGVSGASAARVAAESAVIGFINDYYSTPPLWSVPRSAQRVLESLNQWLSGNAQVHGGHLCTLSLLILRSRTAHIFQVGDSRVWRLRKSRLECLSKDHSRQVGAKKYLTRAMGMDARLDVDYLRDTIEVGDRYLLTTDGIHEVLSNARIQGILRGGGEIEVICQVLIDTALENGADDNLSCQIIDVVEVPEPGAADTLTALSQLAFPPALSAGMQIDGLTVVRELHASNRSHLYLVTDNESGEQMTLKAPSVNLLDDHNAIERLSLESWIGARVHHTNLVKVKYPDRPRSCLYYLMEYIDGITLQKWQTLHPQAPIQEVLSLADQILNGLRALHRLDVIHADIKPGNIMILGDGSVKIIDFGSAHPRGIIDYDSQIDSTPLGVRQYSAPELLDGVRPNEQTDLFSVAAMLYEIITGSAPWNGQHAVMKTTPLAPIYNSNRYAPRWLQAILDRALSYNPKDRFSDAAEFRAALTGKDNQDWEEVERKKERNIWKWISAALLITLVGSHLILTT
jgi:serine/threonine protein phosphatase PrpC